MMNKKGRQRKAPEKLLSPMKNNYPRLSTIRPVIVALLFKCPNAIGVIGEDCNDAGRYKLRWDIGQAEGFCE